ncbi:MAG: hypothetical protein U9R53_03985 [Chloroflexota bacterium]|nr:hypothetical protein [Chloroflexota bacterium]
MKTKYHIEITHTALSSHFSYEALQPIIKANIRQDRIYYQLGHDHYHFDNSSFGQGFSYIKTQEEKLIHAITQEQHDIARDSFGRITHSWQDFYSHSNYVKLWLGTSCISSPCKIVHDDEEVMNHPDLKSGRIYGLFDFIAMLPGLSKIIKPLMPIDSHAQMNLDSPNSGPMFAFAYWAALKRTKGFYDELINELKILNVNQHAIQNFKGQS